MPQTESEYERGSAQRLGAQHAIAFGFARHALGSLLTGAGLAAGDEILLSPLTCKVVPLTLLSLGLRPVYVDIAPRTLNLDPTLLGAQMGHRTRAILFQHTYGDSTGLPAAAGVARETGRMLVEDCAQCVPTRQPGYTPGRVGHAAIFSNNLLKPLPAGSGGLVVTNDDRLAALIRESRDRLPLRGLLSGFVLRAEMGVYRRLVGPRSYWPILSAYRRVSPAYRVRVVTEEIAAEITALAYRPSAFQLEEGRRWLTRVDAMAQHRAACCRDYRQAIGDRRSATAIPTLAPGTPLLYFPVLTDHKALVLGAARARRLQVVAWPGSTPIYPHEHMPTLRNYGYEPGSCPVAEATAARLVGLPTELSVTPALRRRIADLVTADPLA